jgi:spore coat polysaccharide biosynthesis protein SpsF
VIAPDRVAVIVQARMNSRRLPGKALAPLAGAPAIVRMLERVRRVRRAAHHLVATSDAASDDPLAIACQDRGIPCARGPLDDVLGRMIAAVPRGCDVVVRLTGDCPLIDPVLVDRHIERFAEEGPLAQYVSNAVERTFPDGLDVEVVSLETLAEAGRSATDLFDREHVTPWIQRNARATAVTQRVDLSALRWVLDTPDDYAALSAVYTALHPENPRFDTRAVCELLMRRPELVRVADGASAPDMIERMSRWLAGEESR